MTIEVLAAVLESVPGIKRSANSEFAVPADLDVTVFAGRGGGEGMTVGKVVKVEVRHGFVGVETAKAEHIYFGADDVLALRWQKIEAPRHGLGPR
jgi:hypothetical protein